MTTSSTSSSASQAASARQSRLKPPNSRLCLTIEPSGCSIRAVTTCSMRCTSMPATRQCKGDKPSMTMLLNVKCQAARRGVTWGREAALARKRRRCDAASWKTPRTGESVRASLPFALPPGSTAMGPAAPQSGVRASSVQVRLGAGVGPHSYIDLTTPACHLASCLTSGAFMLGGDWTDS